MRPLIVSYLEEAKSRDHCWNFEPARLNSGQAILRLPPSERAAIASEVAVCLCNLLTQRSGTLSSSATTRTAGALQVLLEALLRSDLPFDAKQIAQLIDGIVSTSTSDALAACAPVSRALRAVEKFGEEHSISREQQTALEKLLRASGPLALYGSGSECRKFRARILRLLELPGETEAVPLDAGEPWADCAIQELADLDREQQRQWISLLRHAKTASGSKPSRRWLQEARKSVEVIGVVQFLRTLELWIPLVGRPGIGRPMRGYVGEVLNPTIISEPNADVLKGLAWCIGAAGDPSASCALGELAEICFKKIPAHGARCPRVGNACLVAMNLLLGHHPVGELTRLRSRVKQPSVRAAVEKAISRAAEHLGMSREEVEEISTPGYGLGSDGTLRRSIGSFSADIAIAGTRDVAIQWTGSNGKTVKTVPAEVKRDHAEALKDLQRIRKDIEKALPAQAQRIERLLTDQRDWPLQVWRERYLEHPLLNQLCRRLIWQIVESPAVQIIWHRGALVGSDATATELPAESRVRLWHPIHSTPAEIQRWRAFLEREGVTQPFKQAHRELYILTDAEEETETYSNRFAAHVLRQHQFAALCQARGWQYRLMGDFDSHNTPTLDLPRHGLRAEFWVEQPPNDELSPAGINLRITTDQVRFHRSDENEPMPLDQVPPLLFSEIMRDVDLFVGVASVGNDPNWQDGGSDGRFRAYWQDFSFGKLNATAQTRSAVLESLLPRLTKIHDRCRLSDRFLIVRGEIRTYRIHLGSGNILMEPNDQYLCIVPSRSAGNGAADVFLPFEGDATLSIILSKAFLLAEDKKIKDSTITRQIANY